MGISLNSHNKLYQMSWSEWFVTPLTGAPYAHRHLELANTGNPYPLTHRTLAILEFVPILGGVVALIERIASCIFCADPTPWRTQSPSAEAAIDKMYRNGQKAIAEHRQNSSFFSNPYTSGISASKKGISTEKSKSLAFEHHFADAQGPRPTMEDAHFFRKLEGGALAGVFDGHGGGEVSAYASRQFERRFPAALRRAGGNVHEAFETLIHQIHQEVASWASWNEIGTTAVICYVDKKTHAVYTATLGDSEANLYRSEWLGWASIPLSCVRDWSSSKDQKRLENKWGFEKFDAMFRRAHGLAKRMRSHLDNGVNVSRSIGDVSCTGDPGKNLVIHKPKITVNQAKPGDTLILACDGLKDYVPEGQVLSIVRAKPIDTVANCLVRQALENMPIDQAGRKVGDNVTVVAIQISEETQSV